MLQRRKKKQQKLKLRKNNVYVKIKKENLDQVVDALQTSKEPYVYISAMIRLLQDNVELDGTSVPVKINTSKKPDPEPKSKLNS